MMCEEEWNELKAKEQKSVKKKMKKTRDPNKKRVYRDYSRSSGYLDDGLS